MLCDYLSAPTHHTINRSTGPKISEASPSHLCSHRSMPNIITREEEKDDKDLLQELPVARLVLWWL